MPNTEVFFFSLLGGILPALLWLWFWLREDALHPEPRRLLFISFLMGMVMVAFALPLENYGEKFVLSHSFPFIAGSTLVLIVWAAIEEILKLLAAWAGGLSHPDCDEPLDPMIYLITAALGFTAAENSLFLFKENLLGGLITGSMRFIGASLLHVVCSGAIGYFMAVTFYKGRGSKLAGLAVGIITAIALHSLFNYLVMATAPSSTFLIFGGVWSAIIILLLAFEKEKRIKKA